MKCLNFFILINLAGSALGGGISTCGSIHDKFVSLLQVVETAMNQVEVYASGIVSSYPEMGSTYVYYMACHMNVLIEILITGTSQMSGVNYDYVYGIFDDNVQPPFISPLDCIEAELLSFKEFIYNIGFNVIPPLQTQVKQSSINASTPCSVVQTFYQTYYFASQIIANKGVNITIDEAAAFTSIGDLNLYLQYYNRISTCGAIAFSSGVAELLHVDVSFVDAYLANSSVAVPPPLSCVKGSVASVSELVSTSNNQFNATIVVSSPAPNCQPFYSEFKTFSNIWYNYINSLQAFATNNSITYPVLTPVFIVDFICELHTLIILAANVTSSLSGIDSDIIYNIINETAAPPFVQPLDCIADELIYMRNQILMMVNNVIPGLQDFTQVSASDISTCNATYTALTGYVSTLINLINVKGNLVMSATNAFTSIGMGDLYLDSFASILECLPDILGTYVGSALHSNSGDLISFLRGDASNLPYPFSCVKIITSILSSLMNRAIVDFITGSPVDLTVPNVPKYRG